MKMMIVGVVALICAATGARAADWYTGAPESGRRGGTDVAIDFSVEATTQRSLYAALIGTIAPFAKMEESGARLRLGGVLGRFSYIASGAGIGRVDGRQEDGFALVGYEWASRTGTFAIYGGLEAQNTTLSKVDPANSVHGGSVGGKIEAEFYVNPTSFTMISGVASFSSVHNGYYGRLKAGVAITERIFVGPEVIVLGDAFFSQYRFGAHISGVQLGMLQVGVSGGYLRDRIRGSGAYGLLDARVGF